MITRRGNMKKTRKVARKSNKIRTPKTVSKSKHYGEKEASIIFNKAQKAIKKTGTYIHSPTYVHDLPKKTKRMRTYKEKW